MKEGRRQDSGNFLHSHSNETQNRLIRETADGLNVKRGEWKNGNEVLTDDRPVLLADQIGVGVVVPVSETVLQCNGSALEWKVEYEPVRA